MVWRRRRVMGKTRQRIVNALSGKRRQRMRSVGMRETKPVDDVVVGGRQIGHVEDVAQREVRRAVLWHTQHRIIRNCEMHGHRRAG